MNDSIESGYELPVFAYRRPADLNGGVRRHPIVIVGAGLAGLTLAADLSVRGVPFVLLDEDNTVGVRGASSRGIVYAQKSLEIFDRLGVYPRIAEKGVAWSVGKSLIGDSDVIYQFDASQDSPSAQPSFINIQQFYIEWFLVDRVQELGVGELRWNNRVLSVAAHDDHCRLTVQTPDGDYDIEADWLVDCSGLASNVREQLGLPSHPVKGTERWCISDVRFKKPLPLERWTWVESPVNDGRAVWQHPMADGVWRIDFQMALDSDIDYISRPDVCSERVRRLLGDDIAFELVWVGPWAARTHLLDDFRHKRVLFAGDSAHVFPPLGARGGNSGIQDADNLGWKLALVVTGAADATLLDTYSTERRAAAIHNTHLATRSVRFLSPQSEGQRVLRNAVLALAESQPFARSMVNTGRLSTAFCYDQSPLNPGAGESLPNLTWTDAAGRPMRLCEQARTNRLLAICHDRDAARIDGIDPLLKVLRVTREPRGDCIADPHDRIAAQLGLAPGMVVLLRPDLHVLARVAAEATTLARALQHLKHFSTREEATA